MGKRIDTEPLLFVAVILKTVSGNKDTTWPLISPVFRFSVNEEGRSGSIDHFTSDSEQDKVIRWI